MPSRIVIDSAWIIFFRFPSIRLWWAQVMDTPDARRTDVLRRGTSRGLSGLMLVGGQQPPSSGVGARLEW
jgi:hypothetical protein